MSLDGLEAWVRALDRGDPAAIATAAADLGAPLRPLDLPPAPLPEDAEPSAAATRAAWAATDPIPAAADPADDARGIRADQLRPDDLLHLAGVAARVVTVGPLLLPVTIWDVNGAAHVIHVLPDRTVVATRPSGWDPNESKHWPVAAELLPVAPHGGPSRAEILAGIRRPHPHPHPHRPDDTGEAVDADAR